MWTYLNGRIALILRRLILRVADSEDVPLLSSEEDKLQRLTEDHNTFLPPPLISETILAITSASILINCENN